MKTNNRTMLDAFNETDGRGDVLSIPREDLVRLKAVPLERFAPIFHQLFKWFVDGDETELEDPIANAMLEGFKEHQRKNAVRRKAFLVEQSIRAKKGAEARWSRPQNANGHTKNAKDARGHSEEAKNAHWHPRNAQVKAKAKVEAKVDSTLGLVGDGLTRAIAASPTPIPVDEAKKFLAMDAPQISSLAGMKTANGNPTTLCTSLIGADVYDAVELVGNEIFDRDGDGDDGDETYQTFDTPIGEMAERAEEVGKENVFRRVLAKAMVDSWADGVENRAAFVMARCKRGLAAILATSGD